MALDLILLSVPLLWRACQNSDELAPLAAACAVAFVLLRVVSISLRIERFNAPANDNARRTP